MSVDTTKAVLSDFVLLYGSIALETYQQIARGNLPRFPGPHGLGITSWCAAAGLLERAKLRPGERRMFPGAGARYEVPEMIRELVLNAEYREGELKF